jgi:uncharacterized protein DUF6152
MTVRAFESSPIHPGQLFEIVMNEPCSKTNGSPLRLPHLVIHLEAIDRCARIFKRGRAQKNRAVLMSRRHRGGSHMRTGSYVIAVLLAATSLVAHHSNSAFDGDKVTVLTGTVTEWKWTNPHVWIFLSVDDGKGGKVEWQIEGRPPGILARSGWSKNTFKPGDKITVDFSPARDGSHTGLTTRVTLADGTVLSQASPQ